MGEAGPRLPEGASAVVGVRALASSGAGIANLPTGTVAFVHRTAPGDEARVRVEHAHRRWSEARLEEVLRPGPGRSVPPCGLYDRCGGCALQHLEYEEQLRWKGRFVADALERIGHLAVEAPTVVPSPHTFGYRNRLTFTLRRLRGGRVVAGFHALGRPGHVVDVHDECLLPEAPIARAWIRLREAWGPGARHLPAGGKLRLTLRSAAGGVTLLVQGGAPGWDAAEIATVSEIAAIRHQPDADASERLVAGADVEEEWGDASFPLSGAAFVQVNREAAELLARHVVSEAGKGEHAVDAYCGVGVYGRALAARGWRVTGIERDPAACRAAAYEAPDGVRIVEGAVEDRLASALPADLVVLNPPRTGLHARVPEILVERPAGALLYVSCDPATLARDAGHLAEAYELLDLRSFDLFPQTPHVETVARFRMRDAEEA